MDRQDQIVSARIGGLDMAQILERAVAVSASSPLPPNPPSSPKRQVHRASKSALKRSIGRDNPTYIDRVLPLQSVGDIAEERVSLLSILQMTKSAHLAPMFTLTSQATQSRRRKKRSQNRLHQAIEKLSIEQEMRQEETRTMMEVARKRTEEDVAEIDESIERAATLAKIIPPPDALPMFSQLEIGTAREGHDASPSLLSREGPKPSKEMAGTANLPLARKAARRASAA